MEERAGGDNERKRRHLRGILCLLAIAVLLWLGWGNTAIQVTEYTIAARDLPAAFDGLVIAHVSDLHNTAFGEGNVRLLNRLSEKAPDIIAVTGDLIDCRHPGMETAADFMEEARKLAPVLYVTGNHEARSADYGNLQRRLDEAGVVTLNDAGRLLEREGTYLTILGLQDPDGLAGRGASSDGRLAGLMEASRGYTILLSHRPEMFESYCDAGVDLVLSGHAHGGQVRLPLIGGLAAPDQGFLPKYEEGLHRKGKTCMEVSRGLGNSIIPLRVNNRPELIFLTLRSEAGGR